MSYSFSAPDTNDVDTALRVIADHSRSAAFLVAGGVLFCETLVLVVRPAAAD